MFQKFCMSKQKNLDPWGGACAGQRPPPDPPMQLHYTVMHALQVGMCALYVVMCALQGVMCVFHYENTKIHF